MSSYIYTQFDVCLQINLIDSYLLFLIPLKESEDGWRNKCSRCSQQDVGNAADVPGSQLRKWTLCLCHGVQEG